MSIIVPTLPRNPAAFYLSHGGGPLPLLGDESHTEMVECLAAVAAYIDKPTAIIVVSAHWEEDVVAITHSGQPPMIYDYYGFPQAAYEIQYPAPGAPALAKQIHKALADEHIESRLDDDRGFDHGMYVPLMLMYPSADIPCVQVSLVKGLDAAQHIRIGEALCRIAMNGALIIGSGFSFHNMDAFFGQDTAESKSMNSEFEAWLVNTCSSDTLDETQRTHRLINWEGAPHARYCHPREEHLLPLHVCYGATKRPASAEIQLSIINKQASMYLW